MPCKVWVLSSVVSRNTKYSRPVWDIWRIHSLLFGIYFPSLGLLPYRHILINPLQKTWANSVYLQLSPLWYSSLKTIFLGLSRFLTSIPRLETPGLHLGTCLLHWGLKKNFFPFQTISWANCMAHFIWLLSLIDHYPGMLDAQYLKPTV